MKLSDFTIKARLLALAALAVLAMLLVGVQGLRSLSQSKAEFVHYVDNDVETLTQLAGVRAGVGNLRRYEKDLLINLADAKAVERYRKDWTETFAKVDDSLARMAKLDLPPDIQRMPAELQKSLQDYRSGFMGLVERLVKGELVKGIIQVVKKDGGENNLHYHTNSDTTWFVLKGRVRFYGAGDALLGEFGPHPGANWNYHLLDQIGRASCRERV